MRYTLISMDSDWKDYDSLSELVQNIKTKEIDGYIDDDWGTVDLPILNETKVSYIMRTAFPVQYNEMIEKWRKDMVKAISDFFIDVAADYEEGYYSSSSLADILKETTFHIGNSIIIDNELWRQIKISDKNNFDPH